MIATSVDHDNDEPLGEGGTWLLDLVSVVDHFQRGFRPGFTVWDALDEAIRRTLSGDDEDGSETPDRLRSSLRRLTDGPSPDLVAVILQQAVRRWVIAMAQRCNDNSCWPHPQPRRLTPPPLISFNDTVDDG